MFRESIEELQLVAEAYLNGIFYGDTEKLKTVLHPQALLAGDINGQPYLKTVPEYLEVVQNRKSPEALGEAFKMKVISVEILNEVALVKLHFPMLGYNYYDYLSCCKTAGRWVIVNKLFTNVKL